jgi:hypothetical protein
MWFLSVGDVEVVYRNRSGHEYTGVGIVPAQEPLQPVANRTITSLRW